MFRENKENRCSPTASAGLVQLWPKQPPCFIDQVIIETNKVIPLSGFRWRKHVAGEKETSIDMKCMVMAGRITQALELQELTDSAFHNHQRRT